MQHLKFLIVSLLIVSFSLVHAQNMNQAYLDYINSYNNLAIKQQKEYGIPASITLAQGLLESGAGLSDFVKMSNNHFGIKCSDWNGEKIYHDDDQKGECFRKYDHVIQSYEDHSLFLKNRKRYAFLFNLAPTDYEGWAFGLKSAGYATDPSYAYKLISIIENYNLHRFDLNSNQSGPNSLNESGLPVTELKGQHKNNLASMGTLNSQISHEVFKVNGVKFIVAQTGDNFNVIADEFDISLKRLLQYNDLVAPETIASGTRIFIAKKKNKAPAGYYTHRIVEGESMYSISQDYGIRVVKLYDLNNMSYNKGAETGMVLKLR